MTVLFADLQELYVFEGHGHMPIFTGRRALRDVLLRVVRTRGV